MTAPAQINSPARVIAYAMKDAGILQDGQEPNSEQLAEHSNRLNDIINLLQTQGLKLWLQEDLAIPLTAGTATYTIGVGGNINMAKPLRALQGYYLDLTTPTQPNRVPIFPLSWDEWLRLSTTSQQGTISQYFVDKRQAQLNVSFWMVPDSDTATNGQAHLLIQQQVQNFTGLTDTMNFPQEWFIGLRWLLADDICTGQPAAIMQRCAQKANAYRVMLEDWDVEDTSTFMQPNMQRYPGSSFHD